MLAGLSFTDERRERKKERKRDDGRHKKSSKRRRRERERDDVHDDESSDEEDERAHDGVRDGDGANAATATATVIAREEEPPRAEEDDFFSAALASKVSSRGDDSRGAAAKRREEEERSAKIAASRELNPDVRGDGIEPRASSSGPPSVVGDGGASWRLKALRRAQERAAAEGRNVNEIVSEHWGSVNELVAGIGENTAHGKAHLHARRDRHGGQHRDREGGSEVRMRAPESFRGRRHEGGEYDRARASERLGEEDRAMIQSALAKSNKFASDGSFMDRYKNGELDDDELPVEAEQRRVRESVSEENDTPGAPTERALPGGRNLAQNTSTNMSAAAALRARLFGGKTQNNPEATAPDVLPMVTADGRAVPGAFGRDTTIKGGVSVAEGQTRRAPKVTQRFDGGERSRYYADDNDKSLQDLVREQKYAGTDDYDRNLADNISRHKRYRGKELDVDDEYDHDGGLDMYENREKKMSGAKQQMRAKEKAVRDFKRVQSVQHKCSYCMDAPDKPKHLHVAYGNMAYLMLPPQGRLVPGHCVIAPISHAQSSRQVDEDVWEEIRNFKKCLVRMFSQEGKECCFIETAMNFGHSGRHAVVECIPIPADVADKAPMYFKKAIDEAESEWSTHDAKKCLSTAPPKGLRGTIPANFPYFHVEFNMRGGFVHVIDDETKWRRNFGRNILIGLLDLPEHLTDAKQRALAPAVLRDEMEAFLKLWDPVDWTRQLE